VSPKAGTDWRAAWVAASPAERRQAMKRVRAAGVRGAEEPVPAGRGRGAAARQADAALLAAGWARRQRETAWRTAVIGGAVFTVVGIVIDLTGPGPDPTTGPTGGLGALTLVRSVVTAGVFVGVYGPLSHNLAIRREQGTRAHHHQVTRRDPPWPPPPEPWPWGRVAIPVVAVLAAGLGLLALLA